MTGPASETQRQPGTAGSVQEDPTVACAACGSALTRHDQAVERLGRHEHTFRNPAGYSWTIACFGDAPGCGASGEQTDAATWFPGYSWTFAHCSSCGRHVGWWYVGAGPSFCGLIVTRLRR